MQAIKDLLKLYRLSITSMSDQNAINLFIYNLNHNQSQNRDKEVKSVKNL